MQCHLGLSQGKYCDRAFTFVPFTVSAPPHDWNITPKTHTTGNTKTIVHVSPHLSCCQCIQVQIHGGDDARANFCKHVFKLVSNETNPLNRVIIQALTTMSWHPPPAAGSCRRGRRPPAADVARLRVASSGQACCPWSAASAPHSRCCWGKCSAVETWEESCSVLT